MLVQVLLPVRIEFRLTWDESKEEITSGEVVNLFAVGDPRPV
jgi:hypothetical protein